MSVTNPQAKSENLNEQLNAVQKENENLKAILARYKHMKLVKTKI